MSSPSQDPRRLLLTGAVTSALLLGACGGGAPTGEDPGAAPATTESTPTTDTPAPASSFAAPAAAPDREVAQAASSCPNPRYASRTWRPGT